MPPSASFPSSDSRLKWKKRKRDSKPALKPYPDEEEEEEEDDYDDQDAASPAPPDPHHPGLAEVVLSDASSRMSTFPLVVRRALNRLHPTVLALVDRAASSTSPPALENVSHGQLQVVSVLPSECSTAPAAPIDLDKPDGNAPPFVIAPPPIMDGTGVVREFQDWGPHVLPMHAEWFSPNKVNRLERQAVPHFFSGKSSKHTPESYITLRNKIISKYMESPTTKISSADCKRLIKDHEAPDMHRIVRFLDHWGIINYMAMPIPPQSKIAGPVLHEDVNGDLQVPSAALKSVDSLIYFDLPKCKLRPEDVGSSSTINSLLSEADLDSKIRDCLCETRCNYCSKAVPYSYYQSAKDPDVVLCMDCYHDGKFVANHASIDFISMEFGKEFCDNDGESWNDQETLLLLEAVDIYRESWNDIAEYVGTKSKAQCMTHFVRMPMEDGLAENIHIAVPSDVGREEECGKPCINANGGFPSMHCDHNDRIPFENSGNSVMTLVSFLASAVGPRVAAVCAHAALAVLSTDDQQLQMETSVSTNRLTRESVHKEGGSIGQKNAGDSSSAPLPIERVKAAARYGLSAAATKAKQFADNEEREVQRLSATIINHKLKLLELKLKQFAEVEALLMKECEQAERTRQRICAERARLVSNKQFGGMASPPQTRLLPNTGNMNAAMNQVNSNSRPQFVTSAAGGQPYLSTSAFGDNPPQQVHPHMSYMPRQPMFSYGPRMAMPAINPAASLPSSGQPIGPSTLSRSGSLGPNSSNVN